MIYLLDSNIFFQASNHYYGMDICPGFWDFLLDLADKGRLLIIDEVIRALAKDNNLKKWVHEHGKRFSMSTDKIDTLKIGDLTSYIKMSQFQPNVKKDFLISDNFYIVAFALTSKEECAIVSLDSYDTFTNKIKLPNVCKELKIEHKSLYQMLRDENACFVLKNE